MNAATIARNLDNDRTGGPPSSHAVIGWLPLLLLPAAALVCRGDLRPWLFMWLLAIALFAGFKWQTWWQSRERRRSSWPRSIAYLLLWPGMDADEFLAPVISTPKPSVGEWLWACAKTVIGAALFWVAARASGFAHPLASGWVAMLGLILLLHFGLFDLISCAWRSMGVCARPIMHQPLRSTSLGEFWGKRWNLGFRRLSHWLVFKPVERRFGVVAGTLAAFLVSGLIHDLVISVPARAGYGLPTAYFLIQACGVLAERSAIGKRLGLGQGIRGRVWTLFVAAAPVFILFHPWFVERVILPFVRTVGG
jgi:hypothetical protein